MIKWIWRMLWGPSCEHKFTMIGKGDIINDDGDAIGIYHALQCDKCGDVKTRQFRP